jgi:hypothetical protein
MNALKKAVYTISLLICSVNVQCGSGSQTVDLSPQDRSRISDLREAGRLFLKMRHNEMSLGQIRNSLNKEGYEWLEIAEYSKGEIVLVEPESILNGASGKFDNKLIVYIPEKGINFIDRSDFSSNIEIIQFPNN